MTSAENIPLFCHRCSCHLKPGRGDFYIVRMEAFADPSPPNLSLDELDQDFDKEIELLLEEMKDMTPQQLKDQVYRRLTIHLCGKCYSRWIEDPAGKASENS